MLICLKRLVTLTKFTATTLSIIDTPWMLDLREQVLDFPRQQVITKDNVVIGVNGLLYYQITDDMTVSDVMTKNPEVVRTYNRIGKAFSRDEVRNKVIPAYMGLIKQCDDQMGRLFDHLEATGQMDNTVIVITSDHGDYLGDHWLGEKDLFHEQSVKVPLIIYDPSDQADATRGTTCDALVEAIDLPATFSNLCLTILPVQRRRSLHL